MRDSLHERQHVGAAAGVARTAGMQAALLNLSASAIDPTDVFQLVADFEAFES
jgi:hypothetical protein